MSVCKQAPRKNVQLVNRSSENTAKMFYGHAMLIGGKPERIEIFIVSGLSLSRPVDTKADLKLNNIIATPSSNLILTPLDECQSW